MSDVPMSSESLWQRLVAADHEYRAALFEVRRGAAPGSSTRSGLIEMLRTYLHRCGDERTLAIAVLRHLDEEFRRAVFVEIVEVAMTAERDMLAAFTLIRGMDREWVRDHLPSAVQKTLDQPYADYGEYRAAAVLLKEAESPYLARVVEQADASDNYDIRGVANDFREAAAALLRVDEVARRSEEERSQ